MMTYTRILALLACVALAAACSRTEQPSVPTQPAAERVDLDQYVVQNDNSGDGPVASKATRESLLKELDAAVAQLEKAATLHDAFRVAEAIEDLGSSIAPELIERVKKLPELPRIAGWRAVWTLGTINNNGWDSGVDGLLAIVTGEGSVENRVAAAEVLGAVASTRHEEKLRKALHEQVFTPEVKVQLAVALWRTAKDTAATKVLRDMLASENDSFRIQAALALGEINQLTADAKPILEMISSEPTLRGRTAKRALDYERAIKRFEAAIESKLPGQEKVEKIDTRLLDSIEKMIKERYIYPDAISGRKLLYAAASGMLEGLDPYTCLLEDNQLRDAGEIRRFSAPTLGIMLGSARIEPKREVRLTRVLSVRPGSPAALAGIRPGDRIYRVLRGVTAERIHQLRVDSSGLPDETAPFQTLPLDEAISQFQGALGTTLGLNIMRDGWLLSRWVHLTHAEPDTDPVQHEALPGKLGMIRVAELSAASPARVKEALAALKEGGAKAAILDLRNCAGGSIEAATQVAGLFLPKGTLVTFSSGRSPELAPTTKYATSNDAPDTELPLVVLINGGTADAGEVLAGALREHKRATTAGARSFGRAIVQELIPLRAAELEEDGRQAALLLTVARYRGPVSELPWYDRGVEVDTELKPRLFESWIYDAFEELADKSVLGTYLDKLMAETDKEVLKQLARGDGRKTEGYPGFDEMYARAADTQLSREDVRFLLRRELRRKLIAAGVEIPRADLQEDTVFVGAVKEAAKAAGIDLSEIPEYRMISK
jgi:carboxyl-terminal processing protease